MYLCFSVILLKISIYVTIVKQVAYRLNEYQLSVDTLQFQLKIIAACCGEDCRGEIDRKLLISCTSWFCGFSRILVSCHLYFYTSESRFILGKMRYSENSKISGSYSDLKGNEPVALLGNLKIMENKNFYDGWLKEDDIWTERILKLNDFGSVDKVNGDFIFQSCKLCNGPWIAHEQIDDEKICDRITTRGQKFSKDEVVSIESWIRRMPIFSVQLAEIDQRYRACYCDSCAKTCKNRAAYENHLITEHKMSIGYTGLNDNKPDLTL